MRCGARWMLCTARRAARKTRLQIGPQNIPRPVGITGVKKDRRKLPLFLPIESSFRSNESSTLEVEIQWRQHLLSRIRLLWGLLAYIGNSDCLHCNGPGSNTSFIRDFLLGMKWKYPVNVASTG